MTIDRYGNGEKLGLQVIPVGPFGDDEQVHIAFGGRNAGRKGTEKVYGLDVFRFQPMDGFPELAHDPVTNQEMTGGKSQQWSLRLRWLGAHLH